MARSFSSRKVARAARMGGGRRRTTNTSYGWYACLTLIVLVGTAFVYVSRAQHVDAKNPGTTPPLAASEKRPGDHWFESIGFYTCDKFAPNLKPDNDPYGITTSDNGVILVAPNAKKYAGRNATLGLFAKGANVQVDRNSFKLPGDEKTYGPGTKCGDKDAKLLVRQWKKASEPNNSEKLGGNPAALLLKDRYAVTVGWVPTDYNENNLPIPPSAPKLEEIAAAASQSQGATSSQTTQKTAPGAPGAPAPRAPGGAPAPGAPAPAAPAPRPAK